MWWESPVGVPFSLLEVFLALCYFRFFLFPSFWPSLARKQVMATLQRFIANYSRINQRSRWGLSLGIGICVTGHMPGGKCGRPGRRPQGQPQSLG